MPSDNPTLADLAAAAERDAAIAELAEIKGLIDWGAVNAGRTTTLAEVRRTIQELCVQQWKTNHLRLGIEAAVDECRKWEAHHADKPERVQYWKGRAAFFESYLAKYEAALHPAPEPHVAAAVAFTRLTLKEWLDSEGAGAPDGLDLQEDFIRLGLLMQDPTKEEGSEWFVPTPAGRALLNCGSPVEPATSDAKEEKAP